MAPLQFDELDDQHHTITDGPRTLTTDKKAQFTLLRYGTGNTCRTITITRVIYRIEQIVFYGKYYDGRLVEGVYNPETHEGHLTIKRRETVNSNNADVVTCAKTKRWDIHDGPSNMALQHTLFAPRPRGGKALRLPVEFLVLEQGRKKGSFEVCINGLEWEDGSGESWIFRGRLDGSNTQVHGYYSSKKRAGWIEIVPKAAQPSENTESTPAISYGPWTTLGKLPPDTHFEAADGMRATTIDTSRAGYEKYQYVPCDDGRVHTAPDGKMRVRKIFIESVPSANASVAELIWTARSTGHGDLFEHECSGLVASRSDQCDHGPPCGAIHSIAWDDEGRDCAVAYSLNYESASRITFCPFCGVELTKPQEV
ncbi:MAG: hypothetical protein ABIG71_00855 [Candidatus Uhrbacteria bacterium]